MNTQIDKKRPLYEIVRDRIIAEIIEIDLDPGSPFTTESELCKRHKVGRNTIRKAIGDLEREGYIIRRQRLGIIVTEKFNIPPPTASTVENAGDKIVFVLPAWDNTAGNYFADKVFGGLSSNVKSLRKYQFELKPHNDSLVGLSDNTAAILVVDPPQKLIPKLSELADKGTKIIAVAPRNPLFMAENIFSDSYKGAIMAVEHLHALGESKIGLITESNHHVFQEWLHGFIDAHRNLGLSIDPKNIIVVDSINKFPEPDLSSASSWICSFAAGVDIIARACNKRGLKVPRDVKIIGTDDPGDKRLPSINASLSIVRPDYDRLVKLIRAILVENKRNKQGSIQIYPMKWEYRESAQELER